MLRRESLRFQIKKFSYEHMAIIGMNYYLDAQDNEYVELVHRRIAEFN